MSSLPIPGADGLTELLPCPFCGHTVAAVYHDQSSDHMYDWDYHVECEQCCAQGESDKNKDEAIAAWNRRCMRMMWSC